MRAVRTLFRLDKAEGSNFIHETFYQPDSQTVCFDTIYKSGLVDQLITNDNMKGFGLASLCGARPGYMPHVLKTNKQSFEYCNSKIISTSLTARNGNAHLQNKLRLIILLPSLHKLTQKLICDLTNFLRLSGVVSYAAE